MIQLLPFEKSDIHYLLDWVDSERFLVQFAGPGFDFPLTTEQWEAHVSKDPLRYYYKVWHVEDKKTIGYAELKIVEGKHTKISRIIIGDRSYRGKGYGRMLVNALLDRAFNMFGAETSELNVYEWNTTAVKTYEGVGFVVNPDKKVEVVFEGEVWKGLNMRVDKQRWKEHVKS